MVQLTPPKVYPHPRSYPCIRAARPPKIDGRVHTAIWDKAPWSEDFVDIEGPQHVPQPRLRTRMKMLWDANCLYIAAEMEEPQVWATLTKRDSVIFHDNDFEVFLDPDDDHHPYIEMEMNALNTVWDLLLPKPYRDGGPPVDAFDLKGMGTAVHVDGRLNDPSSKDKGWSVTIAIPWSDIAGVSHKPVPPRKGDRWRINFSRVEWDIDEQHKKIPNRPEHNWIWSPQWIIDMHAPEMWGFLEFQGTKPQPVKADPYWHQRCELVDIYRRQKAFFDREKRWAASLSELGIRSKAHFLGHESFWIASLVAADGSTISIREDSRLSISRR